MLAARSVWRMVAMTVGRKADGSAVMRAEKKVERLVA